MMVNFSDLTYLDYDSNDEELGLQIAQGHFSKFISGKGMAIEVLPAQTFGYLFWKGYLSFKIERIKKISQLELSGFSEDNALNLALAMHDLAVVPRKVLFDGKDVEA